MSGSPGLSGSARPVTAAQKSAEGIVAGSPAKARTTDRVSRTAMLMRTRRQNIQLELALEPVAKGEARNPDTQGTEARTAHAEPERPATGQQPLMEAVVEPGNLKKALARVRRNRGAPGVDGMTVDELGDHLKVHWPEIRSRLLAGSYAPQPVRRVEIPKVSGGVRRLGVPTVLDRFIQQAVMQVLQEEWDPGFSDASYGFRPGRSAHQAVRRAREHILAGFDIVVDLDLEKFFDRVNHDILMGQLPRPAAEADGERSQERGGPPVGAGLPGLQLHGRTNAPAGYLAEGARPVQAAGSGTDAPHDERQIHPSRGGAVPLPRRVAGLLRILRGPLCPAPPRPVDTAAASRRRLEALEAWAYPLRGAAPPRGQQDPGGQDREQRPWPVAGQSQPGALHRAAQRFLRPARPRIRRRRPCRLTPSNRRVRTRTHGGVGGEEPRGSPLSRFRYGPADDSAPRLRLKAAGMAERNLSARQARPKPPFSLVNSVPLRIGPERSRARNGEADP